MSGNIGPGSRVRLAHRLTLAEGTVVEESTACEPLEFAIGDGTLPTALEERLLGLPAGAHASFFVTADEQVFGAPDPQRLQSVSLEDFPDGEPPRVGALHAFHLPNGMELTGRIVAVEGGAVTVDFNPPLAGRDFVFEVDVLAVDAPGRRILR